MQSRAESLSGWMFVSHTPGKGNCSLVAVQLPRGSVWRFANAPCWGEKVAVITRLRCEVSGAARTKVSRFQTS